MSKQNHFFSLCLVFNLLLIIIGAGIYYFFKLNFLGVFISVFLALFFSWQIKRHYNLAIKIDLRNIKERIKKIAWPEWCFLIVYFVLFFFAGFLLFSAQTEQAITSPWDVVSPLLFLIYFLATFVLLIFIWQSKKKQTLLLIAHYLLSLSVVIVVYKLGFGFDVLVHQATLKHIDEFGFILPKTPYYLGQYSLIIIIHKLTQLPLAWLNFYLVPVLSAITLPIIIQQVFHNFIGQQKYLNILALAGLVFPLSFLTFTTPQNFAYLLLLILILLSLSAKKSFDFFLLYLLALATLLVHPLAGIPAVYFVLLLSLWKSKLKLKKLFIPLIVLANTLTLPALFYYLNQTKNVQNIIKIVSPVLKQKFGLGQFPNFGPLLLNFVYTYQGNLIIIILIFAGCGYFYYQQKNKNVYLLSFFSLLLAYFLSKHISFNYLISYQRADYSQRLFLISLFFLLPFIFKTFIYIIKKTIAQKKIIQIILNIFFVFLITSAFYLAYPQNNYYIHGHSYALSSADLQAVQWIAQDAGQKDYFVLANQQVSVGSLVKFGFAKYYKNNIFYYPIPTGGELYKYYYQMAEQPNKKTMQKAMDLTSVNLGYLVIDNYWYSFQQAIPQAKLIAQKWVSFDQGRVYVFKFVRQ